MNGISENEFAPNNNLTRAMLVTVLYRIEGEPDISTDNLFDDVESGTYYEKATAWAQTNEIVKGFSRNMFAPEVNITREQMAAIIYRYAKYKGYDTNVAENSDVLSFVDYNEVSEYAVDSMKYAIGSGLVNGKSENTINPRDCATRAETAAILQRLIESNNE
ncbi:MAG: S-layer homology domain-containing protein [Clostridia bacterium]|nr:S-layer homology domain-containing protein [Clostridia bacterium]